MPKKHKRRSEVDINIDHVLNVMDWWSNFDRSDPGACWEWVKCRNHAGYGISWDGQTTRQAHRIAWTIHHGIQIPGRLTVDHICKNRACCNPAHLRLLTAAQNRSGGWKAKTHCKNGHEYTPDNIKHYPGRDCRVCVTCEVRRDERAQLRSLLVA